MVQLVTHAVPRPLLPQPAQLATFEAPAKHPRGRTMPFLEHENKYIHVDEVYDRNRHARVNTRSRQSGKQHESNVDPDLALHGSQKLVRHRDLKVYTLPYDTVVPGDTPRLRPQ